MRKRIVVAVALTFLFALPSTYAQTTDFFELVKTGTPQSVQAAINNGADLKARDTFGWTALMYAAWINPNHEVITTLLKAGAEIEARNNDGGTPLMLAAGGNPNPEVITVLLKAGAELNAQSKGGWTALMLAA